jgi:methionyl-tRNA formyltransferase
MVRIVVAGKGALFKFVTDKFYKNNLIKLVGVCDLDSRCIEECIENNVPTVNTIERLLKYDFDICFLCEYPLILPKEICDEYLIVNSHGGLLPKYKGFHGNVWALINNEESIGYTLHVVTEDFDSGPIIYQKKIKTGEIKTYSELKEIFMLDWKENIDEILINFFNNGLKSTPQDDCESLYVGRRNIDDCQINWSWSTLRIYNTIRALSPPFTPGAFVIYKESKLYFTKAIFVKMCSYYETPGKIVNHIKGSGVLVKTGDSAILITELVYLGKIYNASKFFKTTGARL